MLQTVQGMYKNCKIGLSEILQEIIESQVFVIFFTSKSVNLDTHSIFFGMFAGSQQSNEADFQDTEFHGDTDDALGWV